MYELEGGRVRVIYVTVNSTFVVGRVDEEPLLSSVFNCLLCGGM